MPRYAVAGRTQSDQKLSPVPGTLAQPCARLWSGFVGVGVICGGWCVGVGGGVWLVFAWCLRWWVGVLGWWLVVLLGGVSWCRVGGVEMRLRLVELFGVARLGDDAVLDVVIGELAVMSNGELVELIGALVGVGSAMLDVIEVATGVPAEAFLQRLALDQDLP